MIQIIIVEYLFPELRYSIFHQKIFLGDREVNNNIHFEILDKVTQFFKGPKIDYNVIGRCINFIASKHPFSPIEERLKKLPKVLTKYLDKWLIDICGAEDTEINRIVGKKWLISCAGKINKKPAKEVEKPLVIRLNKNLRFR